MISKLLLDDDLPVGVDAEKWKKFRDQLTIEGEPSPLLASQKLAELRGYHARGVDCNALLDEALVPDHHGKPKRSFLKVETLNSTISDAAARARDGDRDSAIYLIGQMGFACKSREWPEALCEYAVAFFTALNDAIELETCKDKDLLTALRALNIRRCPGQPKRDDDASSMLAARVLLVCGDKNPQTGERAMTVEHALNALADVEFQLSNDSFKFKKSYPRKAYAMAFENKELEHSLALMERSELEELARLSLKDLLDILVVTKKISPATAEGLSDDE